MAYLLEEGMGSLNAKRWVEIERAHTRLSFNPSQHRQSGGHQTESQVAEERDRGSKCYRLKIILIWSLTYLIRNVRPKTEFSLQQSTERNMILYIKLKIKSPVTHRVHWINWSESIKAVI